VNRQFDPDQRTVVAIVLDDRGVMICGNVRGVPIESPRPLSARAAADYLRLWLPDLFEGDPQHLAAEEITALDAETDRRLGPDDHDR
jgi:hypothetical protein